MKMRALAPVVFCLALNASSALAEQALTAASPEGFRDLVTAHAGEMSVIRYNKDKDRFDLVIFSKEELKALLGLKDDTLENNSFKIVEGGGPSVLLPPDPVTGLSAQKPVEQVQKEFAAERALPITDFDGRNVLYHLMVARDYYTSFDSANPAVQRKTKVRVRVPTDYNVVSHAAQAPRCNNSRYIYADYKDRWDGEIWFHVPNKVEDSQETTILKTALERLHVSYGPTTEYPNGQVLGVELSIPIGAPFVDHWQDIGMDLAKVPSVIYHEAFHWASDDPNYDVGTDKTTSTDGYPFTGVTEGNPLAEDFANYFGTVLNGKPQIAELQAYVEPTRMRDFSGVEPIDQTALKPIKDAAVNGRSKMAVPYNYTNFIPQLLWGLRKSAPDAQKFDQVAWRVMRKVKATTKPSDMIGLLGAEISATYGDSSKFSKTAHSFLEFTRGSFESLDWLFQDYYGTN